MSQKNQPWAGIFLVVIATIALSTEAIAAKIAYQGGATVLTTLTVRYVLAVLFFAMMLHSAGTSIKLSLKHTLQAIGLGIGCQAVTALSLFNAYRYIPAAMAILLLYVYPTITAILAYFILKEPLHWQKWLALVLTSTGCVIILGHPQENLHPLGVALALLAALINALFLVLSGKVLKEIPVPVFNTYLTGSCALLFLGLGSLLGQLNFNLPLRAWLALLFLSIVCTVVAMSALLKGVTLIGPSRSAIISTLEPAFTAVLGFFLLSESLSLWQMIGGAVILSGVLLQKKEPEVQNNG
ncbi:DMT family transporter [Desulforamulus ruminis]|nr:DMT family transporter [Desulforamulus ruminis]